LPRRSRGRFASLAPLSEAGTFCAGFFAATFESSGFESLGFESVGLVWFEAGGVLGLDRVGGPSEDGAEFPLLSRGGPSSELGDGLESEGDPPGDDEGAELGGAVAGFVALVSRVRRGGPSSMPIPAGADSALIAFVGGSLQFARHTPVPSHGIAAFGLLLWRALPTVNSPRELPERSPS
jgi:hypothetical protein